MSKDVHITVHHRKQPDLPRLARALIEVAQQNAEQNQLTAPKPADQPQKEAE